MTPEEVAYRLKKLLEMYVDIGDGPIWNQAHEILAWIKSQPTTAE